MGKIFKILAVVLGAVVLVIIAAVIIVPMVVDPNDYKDQIISAVKEQTGRDLTIDGDIELTVFPWVGVDTGVIELGNAPGFDGAVFARTEKVSARVKLMALLRSEVVMDTVSLHGLELNLEKQADGTTNWDDLAGADGDTGGEQDTDATAGATLAVGGLDIKDARLSWTDNQSGQHFRIENLNAETGELTPGNPVELDVSFSLAGGPPELTGEVALAGTVNADPAAGRFDVRSLQLDIDLSGEALPAGKAKFSLRADAGADLEKQTASVTNLLIKILGLEISGGVNVTDLKTDPKLAGNLAVAQFSPRELLESTGQAAVETTDPNVLNAVSFSSSLGGGLSNLQLSDLNLKLDDTTVKGTASYGSRIAFDLNVDAIDADRYLPPPSDEQAASDGGETDLPVETLRGLSIDGKLKLGKLKISSLNLSDTSLALSAKDGVIKLSPVAAKLYEGSYAGNISLNASTDTPTLAVNEKLAGVQIGPLLKDLSGDEKLNGTANVEAKLTAAGSNAQAMKKTLAGNAAFSVTDGALIGVNIGEMIRNAQASITGGGSGSSGPQKTDFAELGGTAKIKKGLITNNDFAAKSPLLRIDGKGTADLPSEALDYKVKVTLVATAEGQGGGELIDLTGIPIPVHVTGTFKSPSYGVDTEALAGLIAKSKVKDLIGGTGDLTEGAGELIKDGAEGAGELLKDGAEGASGLLEGLLGN